MILPTIANTAAPSASTAERPDGGPSTGAATDGSNDPGSFSSAMANAATAPAPSDAPDSEVRTGPQAPGAHSAQSATVSGAAANTPTSLLGSKNLGLAETVASEAAVRQAASAARSLAAGTAEAAAGRTDGATTPNATRGASGKGSANSAPAAKGQTENSPKGESPISAEAASQPVAGATVGNSVLPDGAQTAANAANIEAAASVALAQNATAEGALGSAGARLLTPGQAASGASIVRSAQSTSAQLSQGVVSSGTEQEPVAADGARALTDAAAPEAASPSFSSLLATGAKAAGQLSAGINTGMAGDATAASPGAGTQLPPAALAALGAPAQGAGANGAASVLLHVSTPVGEPGFGQDVSRQVVYLAKVGAHSAELSLQPAELGPVNVSIRMNGLEASLVISASHPGTRAALQEALPHLSALFQSSGLQLTGAQVGDGSQHNAGEGPAQRNASASQGPLTPSGAPQATAVALTAATTAQALSNRLIDTFA